MSLFVKFWGVRGSIPTPGHATERYGGNTACVELRFGSTIIICDGGTGLRELGLDLMRRFPGKPITVHMFFSHPHWDHIQGFPFFTPAYRPSSTLYVYGPAKGDRTIQDLLSGQMHSNYFPVDFAALDAKVIRRDLGEATDVDGVEVTATPLQHPGGCLGFAFDYGGHRIVYATDNEIDLLFGKGPKKTRGARELPEGLVNLVRGADLLIADGQYSDAEYESKVGWGHPRASSLVDLAVQADVKRLAVTHHDPMQSDRDVEDKIAECTRRARSLNAPLEIFSAREGVELKIA